MAYFGIEGWVALSAISAAGILAILHVLATLSGQERDLHDLRIRATELRQGYAARLANMRRREIGEADVEVVGVIEPEAAEALRRAA